MTTLDSGSIEVYVFKDGRFLGSRCFSQAAITIGRGQDDALKLNDAAVAPQHATLKLEAGQVSLVDNASPGGVFLNGTRIRSAQVSSADSVTIGPFRLKISLLGQQDEDAGFGDAPAPSAPAIAWTAEGTPPPLPAELLTDASADAVGFLEDDGLLEEIVAEDAPLEDALLEEIVAEDAPLEDAPLEETVAEDAPLENAPLEETGAEDAALEAEAEGEQEYPEEFLFEEEQDAYYDGDEDEDDDEDFVEPFSLLAAVIDEEQVPDSEKEKDPRVEIIHHREGEIRDVLRADPGRSVRVGEDDFCLVSVNAAGAAELHLQEGFSGTLVIDGQAQPVEAFFTEQYAGDKNWTRFVVPMGREDSADVALAGDSYRVRSIYPPTVPPASIGFRLRPGNFKAFVGSAAFHVALLFSLGFVAPEADLSKETDAERFAKMYVKDLQVQKPKEKKKKLKKKEPPKEASKSSEVSDRRTGARSLTQSQVRRIRRRHVNKVLDTLKKFEVAGSNPNKKKLGDLVSNIDRVSAPSLGGQGFNLTGDVGKIPGGSIKLVGGSGGSGKETRVGKLLLGKGSGIGLLKARKGTGKRVRAKVKRAPTRSIKAKGGVLSRAAIQKVVNSHMAAIQRCYEIQLLRNPGLAGKIVFDWVIATDGRVTSARQASSSMSSLAVSVCILAKIRTWHFPKPVGGQVEVRYPFVFRIQGF